MLPQKVDTRRSTWRAQARPLPPSTLPALNAVPKTSRPSPAISLVFLPALPQCQVQALLGKESYESANKVALMPSGDASYINVMENAGYSGNIAGPVVFPAGQVRGARNGHGRGLAGSKKLGTLGAAIPSVAGMGS